MTIPIEIGRTQIRIETDNAEFSEMMHRRYGGFMGPQSDNAIDNAISLSIDLVAPSDRDTDLTVSQHDAIWTIERGDFHATYDPRLRRGSVRQSANPWSIDALIRIVHSIELAGNRGFLLHAASAIRNNRAFIFTGPSGAGKTTIPRLAAAIRSAADRRNILCT